MLPLDRLDMGQLTLGPQLQQRRADRGLLQTVVDEPGPGLDAGTAQIGLQIGRLLHRGGLGQGDDQHLGLLGVLQLHHGGSEVQPLVSHLAGDLPVVGAGGIEQQQGVAGGGGIHHHEALARLADDAREGLKHGDLLGTGGAQVLLQQRPPLLVQCRPLAGQHLGAVTLGFGARVDATHLQMGQAACQRLAEMRGGVRGGEVHRQATACQLHRHGGRQGGFTHPALAHQHDEAVTVGGQLVNQRTQLGLDWQMG